MSDQSLIRDINALLQPNRRKELKPVDPRGALAGRRSVADYGANNPTGGGIASPLTELTKVVGGKAVPDKDWWPAGYPSSDGLFVLPAAKTERFIDANGAEEVRNYADPQGVAV